MTYENTINQMHCLRIERLEELLSAACKERDELMAENERLNRENFEQSLLIEELRRKNNGRT